jgi:putative transposase
MSGVSGSGSSIENSRLPMTALFSRASLRSEQVVTLHWLTLADLLSESYETDLDESWENERTVTPIKAFAVRLHQTGCSLREITTILAE